MLDLICKFSRLILPVGMDKNVEINGKVVIPGDCIDLEIEKCDSNAQAKLGPGLIYDGRNVKATKSGILRYKKPDTFWVDCYQKRYVPCKNENVIGVVTGRQGDNYKVDIGSSDQAFLNYLSIEGSSKRNRPNINNGDAIFGKLITANKDMEPEISCIDPLNNKANGMGIIECSGFLFTTSLNLCRKLLSPDCVLLSELGSRLAFEIIIGLNGKIILKCRSNNIVIAIMNIIIAAEFMTNNEMLAAIDEVF